VLALSASAVLAASAQASDQIFWANFVSNKISHANLDGSGGVVDLNTTGATASEPIGLAIDPVGGRVYWTNHTGGKIAWANLDGSGGGDLATGSATVSGPTSPAIDVAARRIYWLNEGNDTVSWAALDGSGGGDLDIGGAPIDLPGALAVDPAGGRLYWTNWGFIGDGWVSYANLDGSGGQKLPITGATLDTPFGMAIDRAAGRLFWVNDNPGIVSSASLDGSGASDVDDRGLEIKGPYGLAVDPEAGKLYLANTVESEGLAFLRLDGTGGATLPFEVPKNSAPDFPALLLDPRPRGAPAVTSSYLVARPKVVKRRRARKKHPPSRIVGVNLRCASGQWAGDLVEAFLYRAPLSTSVRWTKNGAEVPGAISPILSTSEAGNYRCRETATNRAGSAFQVSGVAAFFKVGGTKLNRRRGTAKVTVELPPDGVLAVTGKGIVSYRTRASGKQEIAIRTLTLKRAKLRRTGSLNVKALLTFTPNGGAAVSQTVPIGLKLAERRRHPRDRARPIRPPLRSSTFDPTGRGGSSASGHCSAGPVRARSAACR
jgi:DNA-binding beta-propeller fold protein YncE